MLVVMVRIPVGSPEEGNRLEERFRNRAGLVDGMPGFMGFELLRGESELISMTRWASRADLDRWMASEANARAHATMPPPTGGGHPASGHEAAHSQGHSHAAANDTQQEGGHGGMAGGPQGSSVMVYEVVIPGSDKG